MEVQVHFNLTGVIQMNDDNTFSYTRDQKNIAKLIDDVEWMELLPVYIKIASIFRGSPNY